MTEKLTLKQKQIIIGTNHYIGEFNFHINEDAYGDTASYEILERWLSEILDLDFSKDIYDNTPLFELNNHDSIRTKFKQTYEYGGFIGDILKNCLWNLCYNNTQNPEQIEDAEKLIIEMWEYFKSLVPQLYPPKQEELYIPSEVVYNGEVLYRKVIKKLDYIF